MAGDNEVGQLTFGVGVSDKAISDLLKRLGEVKKAAQDVVDAKAIGLLDENLKSASTRAKELSATYKDLSKDAVALAKALEAIGKGAGAGTKPLTEGQKAARAYATEIKALNAEQKAGLKTQDEVVSRQRAIVTELSKALGTIDKTSAEYAEYAKALDAAGTSLTRAEAQQKKLQASYNSDAVRRYRDAVANLRQAFESGEIGQQRFIDDTRVLEAEMRELRAEFSKSSKEYAGFSRAIGTGQRGIQTAIGNLSRLGLSQQVLIGNTNALNLSLGGLGPAGASGALGITATSTASATASRAMLGLNTVATTTQARLTALGVSAKGLTASFAPLLTLAGIVGAGRALNGFVAEADRARVATLILSETLADSGQNADEANAAFARAADTLGLSTDQVTDAATQLTRYGLTAEQIEKVLVAGGASALAFGKSAAQGIEAVAGAIVTENSQLLNSIGIAENIGAVMAEAGKAAEGMGEEAVKQAKAQAALNVILGATGQEVDSLNTLLDSNAGIVNDVNRKLYDLRIELGTFLTPAFTTAKLAALELIDVFLGEDGLELGEEAAIDLAEGVIELSRQFGLSAIQIQGFGLQLTGVLAGGTAAFESFVKNFSGGQKTISLGFQAFQELLKGNLQGYLELQKASEEADPFANLGKKLEDVGTTYIEEYLAVAGNAMANVEQNSNELNERLDALKANLGQVGSAADSTSTAFAGTDTALEQTSTASQDAAEGLVEAAGGVELLSGAYATVTDAVEVVPTAFASVTDAVDISNKAFANVADAVDIGVTGYADVADSVGIMVDAFATVPDAVEIPIPDVEPVLDYLAIFREQLPDALERSAQEAELFGKNFNGVAEQAELVREEIESLLDQGLDPSDEAVQDLSEQYKVLVGILEETEDAHKNYAKNLKDTRDAQEALSDAASISTDEIDDLIASLDAAAEGTGKLGEEARQAQADLEALKVAREVSELLSTLGTIAGEALDTFTDLGVGGQAALGFIQGAAEEANEALQDGKVSFSEMLDIANSGISSLANALRDDLGGATANAIEGIGGIGISIARLASGDILGGLIGLFESVWGWINAAAEEQKRLTEEIQESTQAAAEYADEARRGAQSAEADALQSKLDYEAGLTPDGKKNKTQQFNEAVAQAKIDLIELENDYKEVNDRMTAINGEIASLEEKIASGDLTAAQLAEAEEALRIAKKAREDTARELAAYEEMYGYEVGKIINDLTETANDLGVSQDTMYEALLTGNDAILGQLTDEQRNALYTGIQAYVEIYGELPPGLAEAADELGLSTDGFLAGLEDSTNLTTQGMADSGQTLSTTAADTNAAYIDAAKNLFSGLDDTLKREGSSTDSLFSNLFGSLTSTIQGEAPKTYQELKEQIDKTTLAFEVSIYGSGGLNSTLQRGTTSVEGFFEGFFGAQRRTVTTEANSTVSSINQATFDIRQAMRDLIGASGGGTSFRSGSGSGGGGSGGRGAVGLFQSMSETIDPRIMGGFGDDFNFHTLLHGNPEDEFGQSFSRDPFGYGTGGLATVEQANSSGGSRGLKNSFFKNLLRGITEDVNILKKGTVSQLNSAIKTLQKGKEALQREVDKGTPKRKAKKPANPVKGMSDEVKQTIKDTQASLESFWDSFDVISGGALVYRGKKLKGQTYKAGGLLAGLLGNKIDFRKGLSEAQQEILTFAQQFGAGLEQNVESGISGGIKAALQSGGVADFQSIMQSISGSVFDGLFNQLSGPILQKALGGFLTDLTADVTRGDVAGATENVNKIAGKLPQVLAQIQAILAPLQGSLGLGTTPAASTPSTGGITLEQRSLGSASPTWVDTLGTTLSRIADYQWKTAQYDRATVEMFRDAVNRATSSGNRYEAILNNGKTSKL